MKTIILIAALLAGAAQAQTIATAPNSIKGQIRLMAGKGECGEGFRVLLSTAPSGEYLQGCWTLLDDQVLAIYSDGTRRLYDLGGFTATKEAKPTKQRGEML